MLNRRNRTVAIAIAITIVLVGNPELLALLLTVQAIGVESILLLLALQARSAAIDLKEALNCMWGACESMMPMARYSAGLLLFLCPKPDHSVVLRQLGLLSSLSVQRAYLATSGLPLRRKV